MSKRRDMSESQFKIALRKHGFEVPGFGPFGYINLPAPCNNIRVSQFNGGPTFRGQLAYLLREKAKAEREIEVDA